jgi:ATP-dependent RNA helicase DHX8/PRP22
MKKMGIKKCPQCLNGVQKTEGCNHMRCRCGSHFCWICGEKFSTAELCCSHLHRKHGGLYDDAEVNRQINQMA